MGHKTQPTNQPTTLGYIFHWLSVDTGVSTTEQMKANLNPSPNGLQKMLNKRETQHKIVFQICLRHLETINSISVNMV